MGKEREKGGLEVREGEVELSVFFNPIYFDHRPPLSKT